MDETISLERKKKPLTDKPLLPMQRLFVYYLMGEAEGNLTKAAELCGYQNAPVAGCRLYRDPRVVAMIDDWFEQHEAVATARERQAWWTSVMRSPAYEMKDRLKASALLARVAGDMVEREPVVAIPTHVTFIINQAPGTNCLP